MMNRCDICGKFRKWEDLYERINYFWNYTFDEADQEEVNECAECLKIVYPKIWEKIENASV